MSRKDITDEMVVVAAREYTDAPIGASVFVDELLAASTGEPMKVCRAAIERAVDNGVVEYGVSARTCWPVGHVPPGRPSEWLAQALAIMRGE